MNRLSRLPGMDGLRGLAVLAVIAYHLNWGNFLPAGFLGVDIFFTVSGFIITALLLQEHAQTGRIDLAAFYLRRARRLFPAAALLLLVLLVLTPVLLPAAMPRLLADLPAALFYWSNWWQILGQQSYFEAIEQPQLLQHLWSLAIEEQYYLLWPLLAIGLLRRAARPGLGLAAVLITLASTAWMAWLYVTTVDGGDPSRVYLGTDTHVMGLLAGSALAAWWNPWKVRLASPTQDLGLNLVGLTCLALLLVAMAASHAGMPWLYQGGFLLVALLSCGVIAAATREGTWTAQLLSTRPMRWLGARSYSLYLWHWPVVVYLQPSAQADGAEMLALTAARLALIGLCAEASYRWVENAWQPDAKPWVWPAHWPGPAHWQRSKVVLRDAMPRVLLMLPVALLLVSWLGLGLGIWRVPPSQPAQMRSEAAPAGSGQASRAPESVGATHSAPGSVGVAAEGTAAAAAAASAVSTAAWTSAAPMDASALAAASKPSASSSKIPKVTLVGDSILLGVNPYLQRRIPGAVVEGKVGRQGSEGLGVVRDLREQSQLGDFTVIHLGTNGYLTEKQFRALLENLSDRQKVVIVNVYAARRWTAPNNALLAQLVPEFRNARLVDWQTIGQARPDYFVSDGIHLTGNGIAAYYEQIRLALDLPEVLVDSPPTKPTRKPSTTQAAAPKTASAPNAATTRQKAATTATPTATPMEASSATSSASATETPPSGNPR